MRRILVDHARQRAAEKPGGPDAQKVPLEARAQPADRSARRFVRVEEAMTALAAVAPDKARVVELRYFGGLSIQDTAESWTSPLSPSNAIGRSLAPGLSLVERVMRTDDFSRVESLFAELVELEPGGARHRAGICLRRLSRSPSSSSRRCWPRRSNWRRRQHDDESRRVPGTRSRRHRHRARSIQAAREDGEGGMGAVFRAERADGVFTQEVAAKVMRSAIVDSDSRQRFKVERQILALLRHPNIVTLLDGGTTAAGHGYLVMEFVDGTDIVRHCRERSLPLRDRLELFRTLCAAVQYAHQRGIVHRDLKPANILIGPYGMLKVLDFGIAKLLLEPASDGSEATRWGNAPRTVDAELCQPRAVARTARHDRRRRIRARDRALRIGDRRQACTRPSGLTLEDVLETVIHTEPPRPSAAAPLGRIFAATSTRSS